MTTGVSKYTLDGGDGGSIGGDFNIGVVLEVSHAQQPIMVRRPLRVANSQPTQIWIKIV